ncbi:MAG: recombinase [Ruminococcaceae bacterium]|nr:recombinase [Oscillospiraceae bacterium]
MIYKAGLYMRLSKDDGQRESSGIESQRFLLRDFAKRENIEIIDEYVDDGYSGTRYDRPAFERMLSDIENKKINTVIVKDLSRLGRNYIVTGELTEIYFPEHFVRLISINDGYDSNLGNDDMAPFRHVVNEMYARDISRKIRSALYAKMKEGQYIGSFAPYGYKKSKKNKNVLVIDTVAAEVVKKIFQMKADGYTTKEIAKKLNDEKTLVPLDYRNALLGKEISRLSWTQSGVCKILRNQIYLGHTLQGKSIKPSIKSNKVCSRERTRWIIVENTHEAIVSQELFDLVNHMKNK